MDYQRIYEFRFKGIKSRNRARVWRQIAPWLYKRMGKPARILDPAAGFCEFLNHVPCKEKWAVDINPFVRNYCNPEVKAMVSDIFDADLPKKYFDAVFISNFLEHLSDSERIFDLFKKLKTHLKDDGLICIMGPNYKYCAEKYYDCADHLTPLTHIGVEELLYSAGYEIFESHDRFLPFSFRGQLPPSALLTRFYLRLPFAWRLLGKQFLILARPVSE
jgi:SAM-dependent methyltransferase